jgi:hypothetical protein
VQKAAVIAARDQSVIGRSVVSALGVSVIWPLFRVTRSARSSHASAMRRRRVLSVCAAARFAKSRHAAANRRYSICKLISTQSTFADWKIAVETTERHRAAAVPRARHYQLNHARKILSTNELFANRKRRQIAKPKRKGRPKAARRKLRIGSKAPA